MPIGGQTQPIHIDGDNETWKKVQKNEKKNINSDTKNKAIPYLKPLCTSDVWNPWNVASITISLNHIPTTTQVWTKKKKALYGEPNSWKTTNKDKINSNMLKDVKIGHGDGLTKWNPCNSAFTELELTKLL